MSSLLNADRHDRAQSQH